MAAWLVWVGVVLGCSSAIPEQRIDRRLGPGDIGHPGQHLQKNDAIGAWEALERRRNSSLRAELEAPWSALDFGEQESLELISNRQAAPCSTSRGLTVSGCLASRGITVAPSTALPDLFTPAAAPQGELRLPTAQPLRDLTSDLPMGHALVRYYVRGDWFEAIVLTGGGIHQVTLNAAVHEVRGLVRRLSLLMQLIPSDAPSARLQDSRWLWDAAVLYDRLLRPMEDILATAQRVVIIPADALFMLPFGMLFREDRPLAAADRRGGEFAVERYELTYAPSASTAVRDLARTPRSFRALVVGAPTNRRVEEAGLFGTLPSAEREARVVHTLFPGSDLWGGTEATAQRFRAEAHRYSLIHLATHGKRMSSPLLSFLLLAESGEHSGLLTAAGIRSLRLAADLVVLSACETASISPDGTASLTTLTSAFLAAGAVSVLSSLWQVHDKATSVLMMRFYEEYGRRDKAKNLRDAQLALLRSERYRHAYFWAPFVLYGSGA